MPDSTAPIGARGSSRAWRWVRPVVLLLVMLAAAAAVLLARGADATPVAPDGPEVQAAEDTRRSDSAEIIEVDLTAAPATIDLDGTTIETWAFNGTVPGPEIRLEHGQVLRATVVNDLPEPLTIHWHGLALRNDMDGVPEVTQAPIEPGETFVYEFTAPDAGTFFYHPHTGTQLDRGLYAPLIVADPDDPEVRDVVVVIDDWLDGLGTDPDRTLTDLRSGAGGEAHDMAGMDHGADTTEDDMAEHRAAVESPLGDDTSDVDYPLHLVNGHPPSDPYVLDATPGEILRLRLINAGSDTPYRVAVGGMQPTVTHSDGFPVVPVTVDTVLLGMGERYDVTVTVPAAGSYPLVAEVEGKNGQALAVIRADEAAPLPDPSVRPDELDGRLLALDDLTADPTVALRVAEPDRTHRLALSGDMATYQWAVEPADDDATLELQQGERVRLVLENRTTMWHPMHLHGATFQVVSDSTGPRKDTVIVPPMATIQVDFDADNPGLWALHCHNIYHAEAGMQTVLAHVR